MPFELPSILVDDYWVILDTECAASFDELTLSGGIRSMVRHEELAWPTTFRAGRLIPAVDYLRADRLRRALILDFDRRLREAGVDLLVHPSDEDSTLRIQNLTGHPAIALPWGRRPNGAPDSIAFSALLDREMDLLAFARAFQSTTDHHLRHPSL